MTFTVLETQVQTLLGEVRKTRNEYIKKDEIIEKLKSQISDLQYTVNFLKSQRKKDKETILDWRKYIAGLEKFKREHGDCKLDPINFGRESLNYSELTQEEPHQEPHQSRDRDNQNDNINEIHSSNREIMSQRVLPMSAEIHSEFELDKNSLVSEPPTEAQDEVNSGSLEPSFDAVAHNNLHMDSQLEITSEPPSAKNSPKISPKDQNDFSINSDSDDLDFGAANGTGITLSQLERREWHPADFKLNPNHDVFNIPDNLKYKAKRRCMHGTDCKDCEDFYGLMGNDLNAGAQLSSRHRVDADKQNTPAGFWRVNFSSSDVEIDRVQNNEQVIIEGRNRFNEAMNEGRYVFKDPALRDFVRRRLT